ncbi:MAG TPA: ATP-binding protein [Pirellulales bacterium]|nr:ATP-binding protein [Pirellulales bacterium]
MSLRLQTALVVLLFLGSLSALVFNVFTAQVSPEREREVRRQLREASRRMVDEASTPAVSTGGQGAADFERLNGRLAEIAEGALADFPGIEGGFYLNQGLDRFAGYAFPTREPERGPPREKRPHEKKRPPPPPASRSSSPRPRTDPPPNELPYIRLQAKHSLDSEPGDFLLSIHDIRLSRVMIVTEPVGRARPAPLAAWVMYRLVDPGQLDNQVKRYQASTGLAIGGLALALLLTLSLGRSLSHQRVEQQQLREELRRSEHLAALGKLLAGVAHEVRNPLAAIRSTVQLWQRLPETARTPASLDAVIQAVDRLNGTVSQLLLFSRVDQSQREPVDVNQLWRETLELIAAQAAEQRVECVSDLAADLPLVAGSASALRQVFLNLATNALQAMPEGGRLQIRTACDARGGEVEIQVSDSGPGISAEHQRHLFEPFFTTRPDGTGLGLAMCREILVQHGGQIEYLAAAGPGAAFRLRLPVTAGKKIP